MLFAPFVASLLLIALNAARCLSMLLVHALRDPVVLRHLFCLRTSQHAFHAADKSFHVIALLSPLDPRNIKEVVVLCVRCAT